MTGSAMASSSSSSEFSDGGSMDSDSKRYNLRLCSQVNRVLVERRKEEPRKPKPKSKPPPLSKYRRKTANCRERTRMTEINDAFEELRKVIPQYPPGKMTKITTLRLALNYLGELRELLGYDESRSSSSSVSSPASSSSCGEGGSTGSVSDCATSPEPSSSPEAECKTPFSDLVDTDTDTPLNQLFELNLDSSLNSISMDTSVEED